MITIKEKEWEDKFVEEEYKKLTDLIQGNKCPGDFSCSGVCPVVPDIHFKASNTFLDPSFTDGKENAVNRTAISIHDLIGLCSQAPFGRNEETVVDTTVRSCWQLNPEEFTISSNPTWNKAFDELTTAASRILAPGVKSRNVELRLYKLLVYEKGSFFLPHRDTQKDENHFGTLVLSLPVKHKGGTLFVRHMGQERSYNLGPGRVTSKCQWAAFYTDVEHEIKEITSGNRITLIYHLYSGRGCKLVTPIAADVEHPIVQSLKKLEEYLAQKHGDEKYHKYFNAGYLMEHKYTPKSLKPENLKGRDAVIYQLLSAAKCKLKVLPIDVRVNGFGSDDNGDCDIDDIDLMDEHIDEPGVEFSELDPAAVMAKGGSWKNTPSRLMENIRWLIHHIKDYARCMKKVDRKIRGSGNEGCEWHTTYMTSAIIIQLCKSDPKQGTKRKFSLEHARRPYPSQWNMDRLLDYLM
ncbi:hypothetical protein ACROYT_G026395 [Oculina patagonica]